MLTKIKDIKRGGKLKSLFTLSSFESSVDKQVPFNESSDSDIENT